MAAIRTETQAPLLVGVAVGFIAGSMTVLALRMYTRMIMLRMTGADDWTIMAAMVFSIIVSVSTCMEAKYGMGKHVEAVRPEETIHQLTFLYISVLHYNVGMNIVKISFLLVYRRIFQSIKIQAICFWVIIGVIVWACLQATLLGTSCLPIAFIVPSTAGWCLDTLPVWYFSSAMSLATDVLIFCIPLTSVLRLQLPTRQKIMVLIIFCLGFFVCIISVYRIWTLRDAVLSDDPPWDNVGAAIWSIIELNCAIICASLPTLRPLIARVVPGMSSNHSGRDTYERYGSRYAAGSNSRDRGRDALKESKRGPRSTSTETLALPLHDIESNGSRNIPTAYVQSGGRSIRHSNARHIFVTTETSVKREHRADVQI